MSGGNDLDQLREQFPGWQFDAVWRSAASGPDRRLLWARCGDVTLTAWTAPELRLAIVAVELEMA